MEMKAGSRIFVDTNILLIASDRGREYYSEALSVLDSISKSPFHLMWSAQVQREYLVVSTRPLEVNGLGLNPEDAIHNISQFKRRMHFCEESFVSNKLLKHLILIANLKGKRIHDANIVATMKMHHCKFLLTENPKDFRCFKDIKLLKLRDFAALLATSD